MCVCVCVCVCVGREDNLVSNFHIYAPTILNKILGGQIYNTHERVHIQSKVTSMPH